MMDGSVINKDFMLGFMAMRGPMPRWNRNAGWFELSGQDRDRAVVDKIIAYMRSVGAMPSYMYHLDSGSWRYSVHGKELINVYMPILREMPYYKRQKIERVLEAVKGPSTRRRNAKIKPE